VRGPVVDSFPVVNAARRTGAERSYVSAVQAEQVLVWGPRDERVRVIEVDASTAEVEFIDSGEAATVVLSDCHEVAA